MKKIIKLINLKSVTFRLFIYISAIWFPFSAIVIGSLRMISLKQLDNTIQNQMDNVAYFSAIINDDLARVTRLLYTLCGDADVEKFVGQRDKNFDYQDYLAYYDAYSKLKDYRQTSMYIDDIFILIPNTGELLTANNSLITLDDTYQMMIDSYSNTGKEFYNYKDEMIYLLQGGNGILCGIKVSASHIGNTLRSYSGGSYDFYLIDSKTGELLGEKSAGETGKQIFERLKGVEQLPGELSFGETTYLLDRVRTPNNYFDIILYSDKTKVYHDVYFIQRVWLFLTIAAFLLPLFIAWLLRCMLSQPMNKLVTAMQMVEQEIYNYKLPEDESQEFNFVFRQYNSMAEKVEKLIQEVYEKQLQVEQAKLKQLQAQINPHFLFNSFYMGYRMAKSGDSEKVAQLCYYLGDYFKVLTYVSNDYISLQEEIKFTETYLLLNQMRFGEKLSYEINMQEGLEEELIPPLLLQPIIENAIRHGVEKTSMSCKIYIEVTKERDKLNFRIEDNCHAITEEKVRELSSVLSAQNYPQQSFGLWNIQQRLMSIHSEAGGLILKITEDGCFQVTFQV